jgi:peptidoglycan glycosyltransferase
MIQSSPVTAMFYRAQSGSRRARARRALPVAAVAVAAFAIGVLAGAARGVSARDRLALQFTRAWAAGQYAHMYLDIDAVSRRATPPATFAGDYERAFHTATATSVRVSGHARDSGAFVAVPVLVHTRLFGALALQFELRISSRNGVERVMWSPSLVFPGLASGEQLSRRTTLPPRAPLLARDGSVLAEGTPSAAGPRDSPLGELASAVVGTVGPAPAARAQALEAAGVPPDALVGVSGLEQLFDERLRGQPGGELLASSAAGARVLASAAARPARALRTTISPSVQRAAVVALGGRYGGIVALTPASGEILAVAGIGLDGLQPPGSTFKMVTLSAVLEAKVADPHSSFPYATYATLDGVKLSNAGGEECGGTLALAFAVSCNSVFAPLGVRVGAARLVAMAEQFGFNRPTGIEGAPESTIPRASQIQGELDLGSTAIGQGQVLATPLQMALVSATIADGGRRPQPTYARSGANAARPRVLSAPVARTVRHLMEGVVREGTGTAAAINGVVVAGKTGTAELKTECAGAGAAGEEQAGEKQEGETRRGGCEPGAATEAANTDAWFAAFAPAIHPRIDVAVLLVKDGAGGATAAPVAREVLESGLARGG